MLLDAAHWFTHVVAARRVRCPVLFQAGVVLFLFLFAVTYVLKGFLNA
jgi:hypothetical protein